MTLNSGATGRSELFYRDNRTALMANDDGSFDCPCCGAEVAAGASFCRECGASEDSGWNGEGEEEFATDDDFDYDDYLEREFSIAQPRSNAARWRRIGVITIVVLVCISLTLLSILGL